MKTIAGLAALALLAVQMVNFASGLDYAAAAKAEAQSRMASYMLAGVMTDMK